MCGRYTLSVHPDELIRVFGIDYFEAPELEPRYNIAPTQDVAAIRYDTRRGGRELSLLRWGLIPYWVEDLAGWPLLINARAETADSKPAYQDALAERRCLIPADGFYEWKKTRGHSQPYFVQQPGGAPLAFAGVWDLWEGEGRTVESCAILTTSPNDSLAELHDRMPLILPADAYATWLDPEIGDTRELSHLFGAPPDDALRSFPVSPLVNRAEHDDPRCIEPVAEPDDGVLDLFETTG